MMPTRNEAWVIEYSLACLSGFCDVVLICDRQSDDATREICRRFPKAIIVDAPMDSRIREQRWQLLDAARGYDGHNLLWATDADELLSPRAAQAFLALERERLSPGTAIECRYYHVWNAANRFRDDVSHYGPQWKQVAFVDDRRADFDRSNTMAFHEPRVPAYAGAHVIRGESLHLLHLQWLIPQRNQLKQAWYRCRELLDGRNAAAINEFYAVTLHGARVATSRLPREWTEDLTFPEEGSDRVFSWHQREILGWFDTHDIRSFEALEIWHVRSLRDEFQQRVGRSPKPDRSYQPPWPARAQRFGRRLISAARRRLPV
jgi:glycosyltransferase involved in cell wall biosynthesis